MKKGFIATAAILIVLVGFVVFIQNVNLNRIGAQQYYVQITHDGKKMEDKSDRGQKYVSYEYTLEGFDSDGKEKSLTFTAGKQGRLFADLCEKGSSQLLPGSIGQ